MHVEIPINIYNETIIIRTKILLIISINIITVLAAFLDTERTRMEGIYLIYTQISLISIKVLETRLGSTVLLFLLLSHGLFLYILFMDEYSKFSILSQFYFVFYVIFHVLSVK